MPKLILMKQEFSEKHVFLFSMVPLQLVTDKKSGGEIVIWKNPAPSSVMHCCPIKLKYWKET